MENDWRESSTSREGPSSEFLSYPRSPSVEDETPIYSGLRSISTDHK